MFHIDFKKEDKHCEFTSANLRKCTQTLPIQDCLTSNLKLKGTLCNQITKLTMYLILIN